MFRTPVTPKENKEKINLSDQILCIGSCFADMVSHKLEANKFNVISNPYGIIFNPQSMLKLLDFNIEKQFPSAHTYIKNQGVFYNYDLHSDFSDLNKKILQDKIETVFQRVSASLAKANWLILTLGTAIIYQRTDNDETVANCHKMPSDHFVGRLLTLEEITSGFDLLLNKLKSFNPRINIVLTVSPVRHIKDTLELNAVSKSVLRIACHQLAERYSNITYFPGYEIMVDDLRDYRFYKRDMIHPSEEAQDYIWDIFSQSYFSPELRDFIKSWQKILKSLSHRPFQPKSENHRNFLKKLLAQLHAMSDTVNVSAEIEEVQLNLKAIDCL